MLNNLKSHYLIYIVLGLIVAGTGYYSYDYFQKNASDIEVILANTNGEVAGVSKENNKLNELSKNIPVVPGGDITSIDTSNGVTTLTLAPNQPAEQTKTFYEDYLFTNNWKTIDGKNFTKDDKNLNITYDENVVQLILSDIKIINKID
jgi:hypothetical protein